MLPIILSFGSIDALIPLIIIVVLIAAAAGLTRGFDMLKFFGIETMAGIGAGAAAKGSLLKKTAFTKTAGQALVGKGGSITSKVFSPSKMAANSMAKRTARNAAFQNELKNLGVKTTAKTASAGTLRGFAVRAGGTAVRLGHTIAPVTTVGAVAGVAGGKAVIREVKGRFSNTKIDTSGLNKDIANIETPFKNELGGLKGKTSVDTSELQLKLDNSKRAFSRSAIKSDRLRLRKEIADLSKQIENRGTLERRMAFLQSKEKALQEARADFLKDGDVAKFRQQFNKVWNSAYNTRSSNAYAAYALATAAPGIALNLFNEGKRDANLNRLERKLRNDNATRGQFEMPKEEKITQLESQNRLSAAIERMKERRKTEAAEKKERNQELLRSRIEDSRLVVANKKVEAKIRDARDSLRSRLKKKNENEEESS